MIDKPDEAQSDANGAGSFSQPGDATNGLMQSYVYKAQLRDQKPVSGRLDALSLDEARQTLAQMNLDVLDISLSIDDQPQRRGGKPIGEEDLLAFNQQLAHITNAGLPVDRGLRLMARDLRRGRMADALNAVADELERGRTLEQAFEAHRERFPRLYSRLIEVGVRTNSLAGVLLGLNRHIELMRQVRWAVWDACMYPAVIMVMLMVVIAFMGWVVVPAFHELFLDIEQFRLPVTTQALIAAAPIFAPIACVVGLLIVLAMAAARLPLGMQTKAALADGLDTWPLLGRIMRYQQLSRWCDATRLGVDAGLGLPESIELACEASASPDIKADTKLLKDALQAGRPIDAAEKTRVLPATLLGAMAMAVQKQMLSSTLATMASLYAQRAQRKMATLRYVLSPILLVIAALSVGIAISLLFLPLISLLKDLT